MRKELKALKLTQNTIVSNSKFRAVVVDAILEQQKQIEEIKEKINRMNSGIDNCEGYNPIEL
jgi:predicted transcriptional regulator